MTGKSERGRWVVEVILVDAHLLQDILNGSLEEAAFGREEDAIGECDRLDRKIRQELGPFCGWRGDLSMLTPMGPDIFRDWLLDAGIDPPPAARTQRDWKGWYDHVEGGWDDLTRHRFWQGLDQPCFYRVRERPSHEAHAVSEVGRREVDSSKSYTDSECRRTIAVFSDRAAARRCELEYRNSLAHPEAGPAEGRRVDVIEIDWEGPITDELVFLVQRRAVLRDEENEFEQGIIWHADEPAFSPYMPLRLFSDRKSAEAYRDEILRRIRLTLNLFDLGPVEVLTNKGPLALSRAMSDLDIAPPEPLDLEKANGWCRWWKKTVPTLDRKQIEGVWGLLDCMRLVEVVELPIDQPFIPVALP